MIYVYHDAASYMKSARKLIDVCGEQAATRKLSLGRAACSEVLPVRIWSGSPKSNLQPRDFSNVILPAEPVFMLYAVIVSTAVQKWLDRKYSLVWLTRPCNLDSIAYV